MSKVNKIMIFIMVLSIPVLFFMNVRQSFRHERLKVLVDDYELEQKEWFEGNKKMLSTYSIFSSPVRLQEIIESNSSFDTADPGQSLIINIKTDIDGNDNE